MSFMEFLCKIKINDIFSKKVFSLVNNVNIVKRVYFKDFLTLHSYEKTESLNVYLSNY